MLELKDKVKCTGCGACKNICPTKCIKMQLDREGFLYPEVNKEKCINCDLCNQICHMNQTNNRNSKYKYKFYGCYNKSLEIVKDSSSGGFFWIIAQKIIELNGVVYGVELKENFNVLHSRAETIEDCRKFRKSKYLESNTGLTYQMVKEDLNRDKYVLYTGTPCQIAGLYSYLKKDYNKLITCDVVCHGVPSKVIFDKYISELNKKENDTAQSITWRDKRYGWYPNMVSIQFKSGKEVITTSSENPYQRGFLNNLYLRPSCYKCRYAKLPRVGDISLADFWDYEGSLKQGNKNHGLSIVIISSNIGQKFFELCKGSFIAEISEESYVKSKSRHTYASPLYNRYRELFFLDLDKRSFNELSKQYIYPSYINRVINRLRYLIINRIESGRKNAKIN